MGRRELRAGSQREEDRKQRETTFAIVAALRLCLLLIQSIVKSYEGGTFSTLIVFTRIQQKGSFPFCVLVLVVFLYCY